MLGKRLAGATYDRCDVSFGAYANIRHVELDRVFGCEHESGRPDG